MNKSTSSRFNLSGFAIGLGVEAYRESRQMAFDPASERIVKAAPKRDNYDGNGENVDETKPA